MPKQSDVETASGSGSRSPAEAEAEAITPLLSSTRTRTNNGSESGLFSHGTHDINSSVPDDQSPIDDQQEISPLRRTLQTRLSSNPSHYFIITLVTIDIACIFADFLISLHICEHSCPNPSSPEKGFDPDFDPKPWEKTNSVLSDISLTISCLFMVELLVNIFAFGFQGYFFAERWSKVKKFHVVDAVVIVLGLVIDLALRGPLEEAGSLIVILRLWRVVKIVEEFGEGAEDGMEGLERQVERLEFENSGLRRRLKVMERAGKGGEGED